MLVDPFIKGLPLNVFMEHVANMSKVYDFWILMAINKMRINFRIKRRMIIVKSRST
jgi:hypothetical protein